VDHSSPTIDVLREATRVLGERFAITHLTLQIEPPDYNIRVAGSGEGGTTRPAEPGKSGPEHGLVDKLGSRA
jgi:hypothetical protein